MSYVRKMEYTIIPEESFQILRNCSGCGGKAVFHNTNCFRVNANGNKVDVWLIYQCSKCKHTNNLTVYERQRPESIAKQEYEKYQSNSNELAFAYGTNKHFFARNKAEVDWANVRYRIESQGENINETHPILYQGDLLVVNNPYALKIRTEKILSELWNLSRAQVKGLMDTGVIDVSEEKTQHRIMIEIHGKIQKNWGHE